MNCVGTIDKHEMAQLGTQIFKARTVAFYLRLIERLAVIIRSELRNCLYKKYVIQGTCSLLCETGNPISL